MKFLVIGLGSIGTRHARNLIGMGHEVWGWDPDEKVRLEARKFGVNARALEGDKIDAHVIASPTACHLSDMTDAIKLGHHIFVEKPIANKPDGVAEVLAEAKRKNLVVMVGNMLRFHPEVRRAKTLIKNPIDAVFKVLQKNERYGENVLLNWGAHEIDLALYLFGPAHVHAAVTREGWAFVTLSHYTGLAKSSIEMDYLTEPEIRSFLVQQKDGQIHTFDLRLLDWNAVYMDEMQAFVDLIDAMRKPGEKLTESVALASRLGKGLRASNIVASGEDGLATLKLISEAQKMAGLK